MNEKNMTYRLSLYVSSDKSYHTADGKVHVYGHESKCTMEGIVYDPTASINDFIANCGNGSKPEVKDGRLCYPKRLMYKDADGEFIEISSGMAGAYLRGEMELYEVEYELFIEKVIDLNTDEIRNLLERKEVA